MKMFHKLWVEIMLCPWSPRLMDLAHSELLTQCAVSQFSLKGEHCLGG